jgi:hypothetical protein
MEPKVGSTVTDPIFNWNNPPHYSAFGIAFLIARLFGRKIVMREGGAKVTAYLLGDCIYVTDTEFEDQEGRK